MSYFRGLPRRRAALLSDCPAKSVSKPDAPRPSLPYMAAHPNPDDAGELFLRTLAEHERWLAAYVYSLVTRAADADDILQECKVVMWKQFAHFTPGTNFRAWARTIALHQVLNYRRSEQRRPYSPTDREFIEAVAAEIDRRSDHLDLQAETLRHCVAKLPHAHRAIVVWRYYEECDVETIAAKAGRSVEAVYRLLSRIRATLNDCMQRQLASPGRTS
jgi:RNA polymerase sigma-70 factor, ECF subfamily